MRIPRRFLARVKNFAMGQRSREFGIRIAVGATPGNVMAVVFHQGQVLTLIATSVGEGAALPAARALTQLLFGIRPLDATSFCSSVFCWDFCQSPHVSSRHCGPCALTLFLRCGANEAASTSVYSQERNGLAQKQQTDALEAQFN